MDPSPATGRTPPATDGPPPTPLEQYIGAAERSYQLRRREGGSAPRELEKLGAQMNVLWGKLSWREQGEAGRRERELNADFRSWLGAQPPAPPKVAARRPARRRRRLRGSKREGRR
jgi:hypothetical protein